jgi:hypothetical protein
MRHSVRRKSSPHMVNIPRALFTGRCRRHRRRSAMPSAIPRRLAAPLGRSLASVLQVLLHERRRFFQIHPAVVHAGEVVLPAEARIGAPAPRPAIPQPGEQDRPSRHAACGADWPVV